jgi:phosphoenolpyruvate carboxylase
MISDQLLRQDIRMLGEMLGDTIREQVGDGVFDHVEQVRALAKSRRSGEAGSESAMGKALSEMPLADLRAVARSFSIFFELANLAEDRHRVRVLRDRERTEEPQPRAE